MNLELWRQAHNTLNVHCLRPYPAGLMRVAARRYTGVNIVVLMGAESLANGDENKWISLTYAFPDLQADTMSLAWPDNAPIQETGAPFDEHTSITGVLIERITGGDAPRQTAQINWRRLERTYWELHRDQLVNAVCHFDDSHRATNVIRLQTAAYRLERIFVCADCIDSETSTDGDGLYWLNEVNRHCDLCGNSFLVYSGAEQVETADDGVIDVCGPCNSLLVYCVDVEQFAYEADATYCDIDGDYYYDADAIPTRNMRGILSYDANVFDYVGYHALNDKLLKVRPNSPDIFLGVELEVDRRDNAYTDSIFENLMNAGFKDFGICKSDSTVSGLEAVTIPATLEAHKKLAWDAWTESIRSLAKGYFANSAGMHVHINRAALSDLVMGKMLVFLNNPYHQEFLSLIAQREVSPNVQWTPQTTHSSVAWVGKAGTRKAYGKYSVMNVTPHTAEIRIFRSSLLPERILKNLEFCDALVRYCRQESAREIEQGRNRSLSTVQRFTKYVADNRKQYSNLFTFINARAEA